MRHGDSLAAAFIGGEPETWAYLPYGPFADRPAFDAWLAPTAAKPDPLFYAVIDRTSGGAVGVASLMRIDPANGVIEIGHIHFSPRLKRSRAGTEALFLLMARVFDELGYRRLEWKCNALNHRSRQAAQRLGFTYEGTFRQAVIVKGRNRDTAWFSMLDHEWPARKRAFEAWLDPANFDDRGHQRSALAAV
jgi:RimJ/RimL family protein N-acetyltransferase